MEIYKPIPNFEEIYQISNYGNVKSGDKLLAQEVIRRNNTNYRRVSLSKNGKVTRFQVHRLVALLFIPNIDNKPIVNHLDNNGENNHYKNLEWSTHSENMLHAQKQGRLFASQSKAGITAGVLQLESQIKRLEATINVVFSNIKILSITKFGKHPKCVAKCLLCNKEYETYVDTITSGRTENCRSCGLKRYNKDSVEQTIDSLNNMIVNNRKIENVELFKNKYKGLVTCLDCNRSKFMYLHPILRKNNPTQCICNIKRDEDIV